MASYCCSKRRKWFRIFIVLFGLELLVEIVYDITTATTTITTTKKENYQSIFVPSEYFFQPLRQPQQPQQPLRIIHPITNSVIPYYHALWNFSTHSIQIKQPNNENDPHPHRRPTSLEILQQILHDQSIEETEEASSSSSCFKANIQQTQKLVNIYNRSILQQQLSFPILNMGMPKCGSTTLLEFFQCTSKITTTTTSNRVNIHARHGQEGNCMKQAMENGDTPISGCMTKIKSYQNIPIDTLALLQMDFNFPTKEGQSGGGCIFPQISFLDEIHNEVPNATFIVTFRPIQDWINSARKWYNMVGRWGQCISTIPGLVVGSVRNTTSRANTSYSNILSSPHQHHEHYHDSYQQHQQNKTLNIHMNQTTTRNKKYDDDDGTQQGSKNNGRTTNQGIRKLSANNSNTRVITGTTKVGGGGGGGGGQRKEGEVIVYRPRPISIGGADDNDNDVKSHRTSNTFLVLTDDDLSNWWCNHVKHIREFVKQYPSHKLIELDLYDTKLTSTIMAELFQSNESCWGHANLNNRSNYNNNNTR